LRDQIFALERVFEHSRILESETKLEVPWEETEKKLKEILKTKGKISRIEAYDISNIQGKMATGSMVTFLKGRAEKNFYRRFKIKAEGKPNDVLMIKEVLERRLKHQEWGFPDLILIDGGKAQLNVALSLLEKLGKRPKVIALAKKKNDLFLEGEKNPIPLKILPREIFNLILNLRNEAHRFAISYHRKLRKKFLEKDFTFKQ
jgi:excinuclease ABC subunit C